jgi:hypothetical protein
VSVVEELVRAADPFGPASEPAVPPQRARVAEGTLHCNFAGQA